MDQNNPVVKLCTEGMTAESEGRNDDARVLFERAWEISANDFDACIAAHYVARHQADPQATFRWNQEALRLANAIDDDRVREFYPSLYLNMGHSYESLGDVAEACRHYDLAAARFRDLPPGPYGDMVRRGVTQGQSRTCGSTI